MVLLLLGQSADGDDFQIYNCRNDVRKDQAVLEKKFEKGTLKTKGAARASVLHSLGVIEPKQAAVVLMAGVFNNTGTVCNGFIGGCFDQKERKFENICTLSIG